MTTKETKETIRILNNYKMSCNGCEFHHELGCELEKHCDEAVCIAISALEKTDKYRWHDLMEDPDDLPEEEEEYRTTLFEYSVDVLCATAQGEYVTAFAEKAKDGTLVWRDNYSLRVLNPIAWKYIETF